MVFSLHVGRLLQYYIGILFLGPHFASLKKSPRELSHLLASSGKDTYVHQGSTRLLLRTLAMIPSANVIIIGVSGSSSSGKTTLSRLLKSIFDRAFILHEDDFYKVDAEIPYKNGVQDWDCLEAIDRSQLNAALAHIKAHGRPPPELVSKEDLNEAGNADVDHEVVQAWRDKMRALVVGPGSDTCTTVAIIDGFLLFVEEMQSTRDMIDVKLFLRTSYETVKNRREARKGYATLEGFWTDPPGYVDSVVWPNYARYHAFLFCNGKVEEPFDEEVCRSRGIRPMVDSADKSMTRCLEWACSSIQTHFDEYRRMRGRKQNALLD